MKPSLFVFYSFSCSRLPCGGWGVDTDTVRTKISKRIFAESGTKSDLDNFGKIWDTIEFRLYLAESGTKLDLDDFGKVWNDVHTPTAAALAAGSVIDLVHRVAAGSLRFINHILALSHCLQTRSECFRNGLGLVRPPGHHAERAMVCS